MYAPSSPNSHVSLSPNTSIPPTFSLPLKRAAFLNFAPAQYKLGRAYKFTQPPVPFDLLLSVQYYDLASQQSEIEADMALSKWFVCGAKGSFDKDEGLVFTFAEKAARKELPSAEFVLGHYAAVEVAREWYTQVSSLLSLYCVCFFLADLG